MKTNRYELTALIFLSSLCLYFTECSNVFAITMNIDACLVSDSLKYLGHASVKIKTTGGKIIYIDPFAGTDYTDSADIVLITHQHQDHNRINLIKQKKTCTVISNVESNTGGTYKSFTIDNIKVDAVPAYNSNHPKSSCVGYVVEFNGIKLYHAGDTGKITEMADLASRELTYALLPMDGNFNMSAEDATEAASIINAKYYIPIHTTGSTGTYSDAIVARFTVQNKIIVKPGSTVVLNNNATSINGMQDIPYEFKLEQNYPNPFNPKTTIYYELPFSSNLKLTVYNMLGEEISILKNGFHFAGYYKVEWNASKLSSGIYFCKIIADGIDVPVSYTKVMKMILMK